MRISFEHIFLRNGNQNKENIILNKNLKQKTSNNTKIEVIKMFNYITKKTYIFSLNTYFYVLEIKTKVILNKKT